MAIEACATCLGSPQPKSNNVDVLSTIPTTVVWNGTCWSGNPTYTNTSWQSNAGNRPNSQDQQSIGRKQPSREGCPSGLPVQAHCAATLDIVPHQVQDTGSCEAKGSQDASTRATRIELFSPRLAMRSHFADVRDLFPRRNAAGQGGNLEIRHLILPSIFCRPQSFRR